MPGNLNIGTDGKITSGDIALSLDDTLQYDGYDIKNIDGRIVNTVSKLMRPNETFNKVEAQNEIIAIAAINKVNTPTLDIPAIHSVTEQVDITITITNFDASVNYHINSDVGVITYTPGEPTFIFTGNDVTVSTAGTLTIFGDKPNMLNSNIGTYAITVNVLPAVTDQVLNNDDFLAHINDSKDAVVSTPYVTSTNNNASYVENIVTQDELDTDWVEENATTLISANKVYNVAAELSDTGNVIARGVIDSNKEILLYNDGVDVNMNSGTVVYTDNGYVNKLHRQNIDQPTTVSDITGWSVSADSLPGALGVSQAVVTKNRVYLLGGHDGTAYVSTVCTAPINPDGTLGAWSIDTNSLPVALTHTQAIVTKNRVYLLGGRTSSTTYTDAVYTAPINEDGTLGAWATGANLPISLGFSQSVVTKDRVYLLGGHNGTTYVSTVYTAPINPDGTLGAWVAGTSLPGPLGYSQAVVTNSRVYLVGGHNGVPVSTVYTAPINPDGTLGTWVVGTSLPAAVSYSQTVVTKDRVYLLGGYDGTWLSTAYTAPINLDGTLGAWTTGTSLPTLIGASQAIVTKSRVYLLSGNINNVYAPTVYSAPFADGWSINENQYKDILSTINTTALDLLTVPTKVTYDTNVDVWMDVESNKNRCIVKPVTDIIIDDSTATDGTNLVTTTPIVSEQMLTIDGVTADIGTVSYVNPFYTVSLPNHGLTAKPTSVYTLGTESLTKVSSTTSQYVGKSKREGMLVVGDGVIIDNTDDVIVTGVGETTEYINKLHRQNIDQPTTVSDITGWATNTSLPGIMYLSQAIVTSSRVYLCGGAISSNYVNLVYSAPINADGTLGTWIIDSNSLPGPLGYSQSIVTKNRVYLIGGGGVSNLATSIIYTALINEDGTLGTWTTDANSLPAPVYNSQAVVTKNRVYILGGYNGTGYTSTVYTAPINADGTLGTWTTDANSLPGVLGRSQAIVTNSRVYLLGGSNGTYYLSSIYVATINEDGTLSAWATSGDIPAKLSNSQPVVTKDRVYLLGGYDNGAYTAAVYTAPINADGTLGTWTTGTSLPVTVANSQAIVTNNRVYLLGNHSSGSIYSAPFADGWSINENSYANAVYTIDYAVQPVPAVTLGIPDRSIRLNQISKSFNGDIITHTYEDKAIQGRAIQRKFVIADTDVSVKTPFQTQLLKQP